MTTAVHTHQIDFHPNNMQRGFILSRGKADLFSSRRGEGKSTGLAWACFVHTRLNPGAEWLFVRDTWENMQKTTMKTFFGWFPPGVCGTFNLTRKEFVWAEGVAKGTVNFTGMDDPGDASKLLSRELGGIAMDEPAPAVGSVGIDEMVFDLGLSSLRQPGMEYRPCKLAENNPDEAHWSYRRFVSEREPDFYLWQPPAPENAANLPPNYYADLRRMWRHRPDLVRRFVDGEFGFQQEGRPVTPQWSDKLHLATGLSPLPRTELYLLWDWGLTPVCIITQVTPSGTWLVLDACVGDGIGVEELIEGVVRPTLARRYSKHAVLRHIGDPQGSQREQSSSAHSAVRAVRRLLGGTWRAGPRATAERVEPLRAVLARTQSGRGVVQVDRENAAPVWWALRGGWHYHVARTGTIAEEPKKSHPASDVGDAMGYGAAILFPMARLRRQDAFPEPARPSAWSTPIGGRPPPLIGPANPPLVIPRHGTILPGGKYLPSDDEKDNW